MYESSVCAFASRYPCLMARNTMHRTDEHIQHAAVMAILAVLILSACSSPAQPTTVAVRTITYVRVRASTGTVVVSLGYEYPDPRCVGSDAPTWCQSSSGVRQGVDPLNPSTPDSFNDPLATQLNEIPIDTLVAMCVSDLAVDTNRYVARDLLVNGTRIVDVRDGGTGQVAYFRLRADGTVY